MQVKKSVKKPGQTVKISIEIIPDSPRAADKLAYKSYKYEIPMPISRVPLKLQLIRGEREIAFDTVCDD